MIAVCVQSSIPCGPNHPHNVEKRDKLRRDKATLRKMLRANLQYAISKCVSDEGSSKHVKDRCAVVCDKIEEHYSHIEDIENELAKYWEYWDEIECTFYDV